MFNSPLHAQSNVVVRIMAANLNGETQSILPFEIKIFKGLKPDVVCIQEFNYGDNSDTAFRSLLDDAFGTNYVYYREPGGLQIPNGIISRYPIIASGRWVDTQVGNRGFAWARIDLPGTNDLYAVSVHLLTSGSTVRGTEANNLKALIQSNFPANAWIVIGGDFNTDQRTEPAVTTFASLCPDSPTPADANGNNNSNRNRNKPYDYVLASHSLTNFLTNAVFASNSFPNGLVFDSRVYSPLSDVSPVTSGDSVLGQHMAIIKDFSVPTGGSNAPAAPFITLQPQSQVVSVGNTASFNVTANGTAPLKYQWRFNGTNISGAVTNTLAILNAQPTNNGSFTVIITNVAGAVTSSVAVLTVSNLPPGIATPPASQLVYYGQTAAFSVVASGTMPLFYQWRFNGTNLVGATNDNFSFNNSQLTNAGNYTVVVTNFSGSITSAPAVLTVADPTPVITNQPVSLTVSAGGTASFSVGVSGATPMDFQWRLNGANITDATTNPFTIPSALAGDAGNYSVVITNYGGSVTSAVAVLTVDTGTPLVLAQWNFNSPVSDTNTGTGTTTPSIGSGNATAVGGVAASFVGGDAVQDPAGTNDNTAWTTTTYPAISAANKTAGVQFSVSTAGFQNISVSGSVRSSNTGGRYFRLQYSTNGGALFLDSPFVWTMTAGGSFFAFTNSLSGLNGVNNNSNFAIRLVGEFQSTATGSGLAQYVAANTGSTYAGSGTTRFDMITISGTLLSATTNPPAAAPTLGAATLSGGQLQFSVSGTTGSNYVVQATTNLAPAVWSAVRTNTAPFIFTETNFSSPQKFYRAISQ